MTGGLPSKRANNAESVAISRRHHDYSTLTRLLTSIKFSFSSEWDFRIQTSNFDIYDVSVVLNPLNSKFETAK